MLYQASKNGLKNHFLKMGITTLLPTLMNLNLNMIKKVKDLVLSSLVADAYSLGAHWIYDEKQLQI